MNGDQITFVAATFIIIALATLAAQFHWLPEGRAKSVILFVAGVAAIVALVLADIPPLWFSGSKRGFLMALTFAAMAFVARPGEGRAFGFPLGMGMAATMLIVNVVRLFTR